MTSEELFYERYILQIIRNLVSINLKKNASNLQPETPFTDALSLNGIETGYLYDLFEMRVYVDFSSEDRLKLLTVRDIAQYMLNRQSMVSLENI